MSKIDTPHGTITKCDFCGDVSFNEDDFGKVGSGEDACKFGEEIRPPCYDVLMELDHELKLEDRAAMQEFKRR
jgi:hypothetical protein